MEAYKIRFINEYHELVNRADKLQAMLIKYDMDMLEFTPDCPISLLRAQFSIMAAYINILKTRAIYENINLEENCENE